MERINCYSVADLLEGVEGYLEVLIRCRTKPQKFLPMFDELNEYEALYHSVITGAPAKCVGKELLQAQVVDATITYNDKLAIIIITVK